MKDFEITEKINADGVKIVVVGVGSGGNAVIDYLVDSDMSDKVKLVAMDIDQHMMNNSKAPYKLKIGNKVQFGFRNPRSASEGREAAIESYDDIKDMLTKF